MNSLKVFLFLIFSIFILTSCRSAIEAQSSAELKSNNQNKIKAESETPEQKAVRLAEEFIKRNGYTNEIADKNNLSHESVEISADIDEVLNSRKNSLEAKAYAVSPHGRGNKKGWTVAFKPTEFRTKGLSDNYKSLGRAVTMDENFENLRVEHKSIFLNKLEKKLQ